MRGGRVAVVVAAGTLLGSAIGAGGAQADTYSCAFTGVMGPISGYNSALEQQWELGIEAIASDLGNNEGDGPVGLTRVLTDTDNGNGSSERTGQDGSYSFATAAGGAFCTYVETGGDPGRLSGVYRGTMESSGEYDNVVCGTGWIADDDLDRNGTPSEVTSVTFGNPAIADIIDAKKFRMDLVAGQGTVDIGFADNGDGEGGSGHAVDGSVTLVPTTGDCVWRDVNSFAVAGAFTVATRH